MMITTEQMSRVQRQLPQISVNGKVLERVTLAQVPWCVDRRKSQMDVSLD